MSSEFLLVGDVQLDELSTLFEVSRSDTDWIIFDCAGRTCMIRAHEPARPTSELGGLNADLSGHFDGFIRGVKVTDEMVDDEISVITTFLINLRDRIPAGFYGHYEKPFVRWDWETYGVRFNSDQQYWHRPESRALRDRLRESGIRFEACKWTEPKANIPIVTESDDGRPVYLWGSHRSGSTELMRTLEHLGSTIKVTTGFARNANPPKVYYVEIEGLEELVRHLIRIAESESERLDVAGDWEDALTKSVALLTNSGRPLPVPVTGPWEVLLTEANELAPLLAQGPDGAPDVQRHRELGPGDW